MYTTSRLTLRASCHIGRAFQKHLRIECTSGQRNSRSIVDLSEPESAYPQSPYPLHPASIDACLQTCAPALWSGNRSSVNAVLIPAIIDDLLVCTPSADSFVAEAVSIASAQYVGVGRPDQTKNYMGNATVYEPDSGEMIFRVKGLRFHKLDMDQDERFSHKYTRLQWAPDADFLSESGLSTWLQTASARDVNQVLDLLVHKKPSSKVTEICLLPDASTSFWLDGDNGIRQCCRKFSFLSSDAKALVSAQEQYAGHSGTTFEFFNPAQFAVDDEKLDIVILRTSGNDIPGDILTLVRNALGNRGKLLLIQDSLIDKEAAELDIGIAVKRSLTEAGFSSDAVIDVRLGNLTSKVYLARSDNEDTATPR